MLKALRDNIIVIKHKKEEKKDSLIIIPELKGHYNSYEASELCEVVSVGPRYDQRYSDGKSLSEGDFILCEHLEGKKIVHENKDYFVMYAYQVQAKVDKEFLGRIGTFNPSISNAEWEAGKEHFKNKGHKVVTV